MLAACNSHPENAQTTTQAAAQDSSAAAPADTTNSLSASKLEDVYQADTIWNGVAVSDNGRAFVLFPHNEGSAGTRIGEIKNGKAVPYPNQNWNNWKLGADAKQKFVRANSLRFGPDGNLWVIDTGTPKSDAAPVPNGPKLLAFDIKTNKLVRSIPLDAYAKPKSFVDDLRFHADKIYVTDAGAPALIVLDTKTGKGRRVLENDTSTTARRPMYGEGKRMVKPTGEDVALHADQMEVSPDGNYYYWQSAAGPMYRLETRLLDDPNVSSADLAKQVKYFYNSPTTGGTAIDANGNIYLNDCNHKRLLKISPEGQATTLLQDDRLVWADAMWIDNKGNLWIPAAQINRSAGMQQGKETVQFPVHIYKLALGLKPLRN
ncbi:hypothetical protein BXP70_09245 [Hymenobacter crusticola]|uniref:Gluconolactonase n=1 Tax=Hymenobacter crusticola TaxID=1770526 RepID=A0A243WIH9_9BACT|nr:hypothetical protein BXP70_09245 [Hymenobacter crusticola]